MFAEERSIDMGRNLKRKNSGTSGFVPTKEQISAQLNIAVDNLRLLSNLQGVTSTIPRSSTVPPRFRETSRSVNQRHEARRVDSENLKMADRLENIRVKSTCPAKKSRDLKDIPPGWTRGVGGRLLPPPKLRWGKKYDAGEWLS